jgi:membrane protease YdiL (CAAX protease family)
MGKIVAQQSVDFPYYDGLPVALNDKQWILLMFGVVAGFIVLSFGLGGAVPTPQGFVPAVLYVAIPLTVLAYVSRGHRQALFRSIRGRDVLLMFGFAILNLIVTITVGLLLIDLDTATVNATVAGLADLGAGELVLSYLRAAIQLVGEEVMTILPFLGLLYLFATRMRTRRTTAILLAWVITALLFAAAHLPTYGWNILQVLSGVGIARLVLTLPYILTKNLWVSSGAHILNDWMMFSVTVLFTGMGVSAE